MTDLIERMASAVHENLEARVSLEDMQKAASILLREMALENLPLAVKQAGGEFSLDEGVRADLAGDIWEAMLKAFAKSHSINLEGE